MERVLSYTFDDLWVSSLRRPPPKSNLNRSSSEWSFQKFLDQIPDSFDSFNTDNNGDNGDNGNDQVFQIANPSVFPPSAQTSDLCNNTNDDDDDDDDEVVEIENPNKTVQIQNPKNFQPFSVKIPDSNGNLDPDEYQAMLRRKLEIELSSAAAVLSPASLVKDQDFNKLRVSDVQSRFQDLKKEPGCSFLIETEKPTATPLSLPTVPCIKKELTVQTRPTTSVSSGDRSDDEDLLEVSETANNVDLCDVKGMRRKKSNRESARRSRERRQAQTDELESQVKQLTVEKSVLTKLLTETSQNYKEAVFDNRILRASIDTLRVKVIFAENMIQQLNRSNQMFPAINMPTQVNSAYSDSASHINKDMFQQSSLIQPNDHGMLNDVVAGLPPFPEVQEVQNCGRQNKMGRTPSMQRVTSLEHLKKRVCGGKPNS